MIHQTSSRKLKAKAINKYISFMKGQNLGRLHSCRVWEECGVYVSSLWSYLGSCISWHHYEGRRLKYRPNNFWLSSKSSTYSSSAI